MSEGTLFKEENAVAEATAVSLKEFPALTPAEEED
jgi:hypothetical protein